MDGGRPLGSGRRAGLTGHAVDPLVAAGVRMAAVDASTRSIGRNGRDKKRAECGGNGENSHVMFLQIGPQGA